jgi:hypothetical protein
MFKKGFLTLVITLAVSTGMFAQGMNGMMQQQPQNIPAVEDAELEEFVSVAVELEKINAESQTKIQKMIEDEGMTTQEFSQIYQVKANPKADQAKLDEFSEEKIATVDELLPKLNEVQQASQQKTMAKVQESDLSIQRFTQINQKLQGDQELQQRFQQLMMAQQQNQQ